MPAFQQDVLTLLTRLNMASKAKLQHITTFLKNWVNVPKEQLLSTEAMQQLVSSMSGEPEVKEQWARVTRQKYPELHEALARELEQCSMDGNGAAIQRKIQRKIREEGGDYFISFEACDPLQCVASLLVEFRDDICFPNLNDHPNMNDMVNAGWFHEAAAREAPRRVLGVLVASNKTHIDSKGKKTAHSCQISLGNLPKRTRDLPTAWRLLGYLPSRTDFIGDNNVANKAREVNWQVRAVIEATMYARLREAAQVGVKFTQYVGNVQHTEEYAVHLAAGIVDMAETWAMVGCWQRCPLCKVKDMDDAQQDAHPQAVAQLRSNADKASLLSGIGYLLRAGCSDAVARADWKAAGYSYTGTSVWEDMPHVNPFEQLSLPDLLHCVHLGLAKKLIGLFPTVLKTATSHSERRGPSRHTPCMSQRVSNLMVHVISKQRSACDTGTVPDSFRFVGEDGSVGDARMDGNHYKTIIRRMPVALWVAMKTISEVYSGQAPLGNLSVMERYFHCIVALLDLEATLEYESYDNARLGEVQDAVTAVQTQCNTLAAVLSDPNLWKKTPKFHIILHLPHYIRRFGPPTGFDTQVTEGNHKVLAKQPGTSVRTNSTHGRMGAKVSYSQGLRRLRQLGRHAPDPKQHGDLAKNPEQGLGVKFVRESDNLHGEYTANELYLPRLQEAIVRANFYLNDKPVPAHGGVHNDRVASYLENLERLQFSVHKSMHIRVRTGSDVIRNVQPTDWVHCGQRKAYAQVRVIFQTTGIFIQNERPRPLRTWVVVERLSDIDLSDINYAPLVHHEGGQLTTSMPLTFMKKDGLDGVEVWDVDDLTGPHPIEETWGYVNPEAFKRNEPAMKNIICFLSKWRS